MSGPPAAPIPEQRLDHLQVPSGSRSIRLLARATRLHLDFIREIANSDAIPSVESDST